jgi:DNA (cytosine-5)-methyltransferase 1
VRIGSLCSGYGGLDMGVRLAIGGTVAWHVEYDPDPSRILAHHWPDIPNHGDVKTTDWSAVEPVDVLTAGYPCQPFSHAGNRKGADDPRHLWPDVARAISCLRPRLVVLENVRGHVSLGLDAVVGDLSRLGYDAQWDVVRASDVGAPHGRARIFIAAHPNDAAGHGEWARAQFGQGGPATADDAHDGRERGDAHDGRERGGASRGWRPGPANGDLLPTPAVNDMGEGKTPDAWDAWTAAMQERHGNGNGHGKSLAIEAQRLLPTPNAADAWVPMEATENTMRRGDPNGTLRSTSGSLPKDLGLVLADPDRWGVYADAIARWEALTRPAPPPTQPSKKGTPQLSPLFSEWLMGAPAGHVTDVPGLSRNAQLKALGNGVVPQQAALAVRMLLA